MMPQAYKKYEACVTVGCVNYDSVWGDKAANLEKIKAMVREAACQGVNIVAFPELSLSGYEANEDYSMHRRLAESIPGPTTEEIAALAKELDIYVILSMPEHDPKDGLFYISCPLIGPEGLIGTYRKLHIAPPPIFSETLTFNGGNSVPVFETRYGPIGIQICADFWCFPELSRILMLKGARLIFNCSGSPDLAPDRPYYIGQQTGARATENLVYTATANMTGTENKLSYYGHSTIAGPDYPRFAKIYAQGGYQEELVTATLNFSKLHRFRQALNLEELRRSEVILNELQQLSGAKHQHV